LSGLTGEHGSRIILVSCPTSYLRTSHSWRVRKALAEHPLKARRSGPSTEGKRTRTIITVLGGERDERAPARLQPVLSIEDLPRFAVDCKILRISFSSSDQIRWRPVLMRLPCSPNSRSHSSTRRTPRPKTHIDHHGKGNGKAACQKQTRRTGIIRLAKS
jgi:hypothetical protein